MNSPQALLPLAALCVGAAALPTSAQCSWTATSKLVSSTAYQAESYLFGRSMGTDGARLVIGAPGLDGFPGAAFTFDRLGEQWYPFIELVPSLSSPDDFYGAASALEGDHLFVGAPGAARVFVFRSVAGVWGETQLLIDASAESSEDDSEFGAAVALHGQTAVVGDPKRERAHVLSWDGESWITSQVLTPPDGDEFGEAVALEGDRLVIGDPDAGRVHVFERSAGQFVHDSTLTAPSGLTLLAEFGSAVSLDGDRLAIGAPADDEGIGSVFVFERDANGWSQVAELSEGAPAPGVEMEFGTSLDLFDGRLLVGAPLDEGGVGTAWLYAEQAGSWTLSEKIQPALGPGEVNFGNAVHLSDHEAMANVGIDEVPVLGDPIAYVGSVQVWRDEAGPCPSLLGFPTYVSASAGGAIDLWLEAGPAQAGRTYLVLGSFSGSGSGVPFGGQTIPLGPDVYFQVTLASPNSPSLQNSLGVLDSEGRAQARFEIPAGLPYSFVNADLAHAFVVLDPSLPELLSFISTAYPAWVLP